MSEDIKHVYRDERAGNEGRKQWNAREHTREDNQQMLNGAIQTIDRLLDILNPPEPPRTSDRERIRAITFSKDLQ